MKPLIARSSIARPLALCILLSAPLTLVAQNDGNGPNGPPKILVVQREMLKPGKAGSLHEKTESAYIRAFTAAHSDVHYFGLDSVTGLSRSLFFSGYPSLEAWQQSLASVRNNATLAAAIDRADIADGELQTEYQQSAFLLREDLSYNLGNLVGTRYMEVAQFVTHPGHEKEIEDLAKMYVAGYKEAAIPDANWATFQMIYGANTGTVYLVITRLKSLAEADHELPQAETFAKHMGPDGMKKIAELTASSIASQQSNLFEINPKISNPPDAMVKAEPAFWKPKPAAPPKQAEATTKAEARPAKE
jgi:hypothetical protein